MGKIKLSLVIPVFNVEDYLVDCLESIIKQNSDDIEIILVDDGSDDSSGMICDTYSSKYKNVFTYHKVNGGLSDSRNFGTKKAKGDYISFVDSDDYIEQNSISYILNLLKQENPDVLVLNHGQFVDIIPYADNSNCSTTGYKSGLCFLNHELKNKTYMACVPFSIYRKELVDSHSFEYGIIHEDELWSPVLFDCANKVIKSTYCYYSYRTRPESITTKKDKTKGSRDLIYICKALYSYFAEKKRADKKRSRTCCSKGGT